MGLLGHYVKLTDGPRHANKVQHMACYYKIFINLLLFQTKLFVSVLCLLYVLASTYTFEFGRRSSRIVFLNLCENAAR